MMHFNFRYILIVAFLIAALTGIAYADDIREILNSGTPLPVEQCAVVPLISQGIYDGKQVDVLDFAGDTFFVRCNGAILSVSQKSVDLTGFSTAILQDSLSESFIEIYVSKAFTNPFRESPYFLWADLARQKLYVLRSGKLERTVCVSSGKAKTPTNRGVFRIYQQGERLQTLEPGIYANDYLRFNGPYLIHSFPTDVSGKVTDRTLGVPASHGCIRCSLNDAKWLRTKIPLGTWIWVN